MIWVVIGTIAVILIVGGLFGKNIGVDIFGDEYGTTYGRLTENSLGSLCSGEEECIEFCLDNLGQCEIYCTGKEDELCGIIFPVDNAQKAETNALGANCVSNPNPVFTHAFTDDTKISEISQIGSNAFYNPGSQARSYVSVKEGENTPVYAPTDAKITRIHYSDKNYSFISPGFIRPEYRINFEVSCEVEMAYDHILNITNKLKEYAPQVSASGRNDGIAVSIPVQAGELIGYTSGSFPGRAFDFVFVNKARLAQHINPARWTTDNSKYADCPYDYFTDDLKNKYYTIIQRPIGSSLTCGPLVRDIAGTISGYWFQGNADESRGNRFGIYESKHFVEFVLAREGEPFFFVRDTSPSRISPKTVTSGNSACYYDDEKNTYAYLKMLSTEELGLATGNGRCPSSFPTQYETWAR